MFKFLARKMMEVKTKNLPPEQRDLIMTLMNDHPELMEKIAKEIKEKKKQGIDEQTASMQVMFRYKDDFQRIMMNKMKR
jgi:adenylate kinase